MNLFGQYKSIKIEKNDYIENEIVQIDFREFSTLVHFKFRSNSLVGNVIYINEAFYIKDNKTNKKYKLLNSYNLPLGNNNKYAVLEEEDEIIHYTLEFEKVPDSAENLDIIESLKGEAFNFYGVSINKKIKEDNFMDINTFTKETPIKEMNFYYKDGGVVEYYEENGLKIALQLSYVNNYGTYFRANILIQNLTGKDLNFNPSNISAKIDTKKGKDAEVLTYNKYMKKVKRKQNWNAFAVSFSESMAASNAGYTSSNTQTNLNSQTRTNAYAYGYSGNIYASAYGTSYSNTNANVSSTTQSYNGSAAYAAQQNASNNISNYQNKQYKIRQTLSEGYLKLNTIMNETEYLGYVNIKYKKTDRIQISIPINGKTYTFVSNMK
tara:strand:- start:199 stop:1338 length:1140 start_codon:yes stop_codon:yes gene_type:complete